MTKTIVLVGGGGHCKSCIDVIETTDFKIGGIIDNKPGIDRLSGYEVIGGDDKIKECVTRGSFFLVTVGQIKRPDIRVALFEKIAEALGKLATVVASSAIISKSCSIEQGTIVMHQAVVNASSKVGCNCIINTKALIEHDCIIGDHCHISTSAVVNGNCSIGKKVFVGSNAVITHGIRIADDVVVGSGSVVIRDILEKGIYAGNPVARIDQ